MTEAPRTLPGRSESMQAIQSMCPCAPSFSPGCHHRQHYSGFRRRSKWAPDTKIARIAAYYCDWSKIRVILIAF